MKHRSSRGLYDAVGALLAVVLLVVALGPIVKAGGLDRDRMCVDNVYRLIPAVKSYAEDYDEVLPPMQNYSAFQRVVAPYAQDSPRNIFYCPATHYASYSLNRSLSGKWVGAISSYGDFETVELERDSRPHPDGKLTVGFLDGHVERGGIDQADPNAECVDRVRGLAEGILMYAQDYDEHLPVAYSDAHYQDLVYPYVKSRSIFECPATKQAYEFNLSINGRTLGFFAVPAQVPLLRDTSDHPDGKRTVGFLDEHVERGGVFQPPPTQPIDPEAVCTTHAKQLALGVLMYVQDFDERFPPMADFDAFHDAVFPYVKNDALFVCPPSNQPFVLNADLDHISLASIPAPAETIMFRAPMPGPSGLTVTAFADGHVKKVP
jgi:prepilin-type processing-associated H-X9-DG protein